LQKGGAVQEPAQCLDTRRGHSGGRATNSGYGPTDNDVLQRSQTVLSSSVLCSALFIWSWLANTTEQKNCTMETSICLHRSQTLVFCSKREYCPLTIRHMERRCSDRVHTFWLGRKTGNQWPASCALDVVLSRPHGYLQLAFCCFGGLGFVRVTDSPQICRAKKYPSLVLEGGVADVST
jgi:hypothetical protein